MRIVTTRDMENQCECYLADRFPGSWFRVLVTQEGDLEAVRVTQGGRASEAARTEVRDAAECYLAGMRRTLTDLKITITG